MRCLYASGMAGHTELENVFENGRSSSRSTHLGTPNKLMENGWLVTEGWFAMWLWWFDDFSKWYSTFGNDFENGAQQGRMKSSFVRGNCQLNFAMIRCPFIFESIRIRMSHFSILIFDVKTFQFTSRLRCLHVDSCEGVDLGTMLESREEPKHRKH